MDRQMVIARAFGGEPLKRMAVGIGDKAVHLVDPDLIPQVEMGVSFPVGFPLEDVYAFDEAIFLRLHKAWKHGRGILASEWSELQRFHSFK